ncbi:transcriptional regulator family: Fungal Specific TF [Penicillium lagena]|uniref:transcriptional regulator family: Fungal Specific TF n=1 Tax=Penicillium lagena TaxID=94218 RepID=UPI0025405C96|nr:transcriptional regulator family: Fungal Specific TF [Penicillium lagena]KAJ5620628.1 transcriptional regulator family: Fungal Specific TF [Penicillium lagena]
MADSFDDKLGPQSASQGPLARKKFAKPPVKVAFALQEHGAPGKIPVLVGHLKKRILSPAVEEQSPQEDVQYADIPQADFEAASEIFDQIDLLSVPGAGLRHLDLQSDIPSIFQGVYSSDGFINTVPSELGNSSPCLVRTYGSEAEMPLNCPISFANPASEVPLMVYRPRSPLSLAVSAILALIPHPNDPEPSSTASVTHRRTYAHTLAQLANTAIESDCDLDVSSCDPGQALSSGRPFINRERFHPQTPADLESLLALLVLSVYEYCQRGNLLKMRYRAGQALAIALDKSLHAHGEEIDEFSEARRRAWWMTYHCVIQGSITSTTPPAIVINDPQFTTPYPRFATDVEGWSIFTQAQQVLLSATQFVADLNKCLTSGSDMHYLFERMQHLDGWINSVLTQIDLLPPIPQETGFGDYQETMTAHTIRAISRIKLSSAQIKVHRFRAFSDIPIFIKKHCDLTAAANPNAPKTDAVIKSPMSGNGHAGLQCLNNNIDPFQRASSTEYLTPPDSSTSSEIRPSSIPQYPRHPFTSGFPYSCEHSAKVCLGAALVISRMLKALPLPQPLLDPQYQHDQRHQQQQQHYYSGSLPRTMPYFACCLMHSSYTLLMVFYKARVAKRLSPDSENDYVEGSTDQLIAEIRQGLQHIIAASSNYSLAFEALDGMRDEIKGAYQAAFSLT